MTARRQSVVTVMYNGDVLNGGQLQPRACKEFDVPIMKLNKFEIKLSGEIYAEWDETFTDAYMMDTSTLFLVPYVFGFHADTTFSVNEFRAQSDQKGASQVAFMDVHRNSQPCQLKLHPTMGSGMDAATSIAIEDDTAVQVCTGEYTLHFVKDGDEFSTDSGTSLNTERNEQYLVLRMAEGNGEQDHGLGNVIVFP